ncbi:IclR family transcriptional regulator [Natronorarus salvus]|uniref:IclR family transcriptional regulator n=1 Tax=Natronorarus salvus TaxID=3117733 RepID=UPI002F26289D
MDGTSGKKIQATQNSLDVLEEIYRQRGCSLSVLADNLTLSKSTLHAHVKTLQERGYVVEENGEYRTGLMALTLGGYVQTAGKYGKLYQVAKPEVDDLAEQTGERAQITVEQDGVGYFLYQARGARAVVVDTHIGSRVHLHSTAAGKSILAHVSEQRREEILGSEPLPKDTSNTLTSKDDLLDELDKINQSKYATDWEERIPGICCVATPIVADDGTVFGALSISIPKKRASEELCEEEIPDMLINSARVISLNVLYS